MSNISRHFGHLYVYFNTGSFVCVAGGEKTPKGDFDVVQNFPA